MLVVQYVNELWKESVQASAPTQCRRAVRAWPTHKMDKYERLACAKVDLQSCANRHNHTCNTVESGNAHCVRMAAFTSTHICRLRHNVIPRNPREGHREITMFKIMLFVKQQTPNKTGIERLLLQAVRIFRCDKVKHLSHSSAAILVVPGQCKEWIGINTCMCIRR